MIKHIPYAAHGYIHPALPGGGGNLGAVEVGRVGKLYRFEPQIGSIPDPVAHLHLWQKHFDTQA